MIVRALGLADAALFILSGPALARHSFAMFDVSKTVEFRGTVKEFQWSNPHSWLVVVVENDQGEPIEWSLESDSLGKLARIGWRPDIVTPGDEVTVKLHPRKDGGTGGQLISVTLPNGTTLEGK